MAAPDCHRSTATRLALAIVRRDEQALVLLDVKLPDINGIEVCRRIKAEAATAKVLVLQTSAALAGSADKVRGLEGGADNYLAAFLWSSGEP